MRRSRILALLTVLLVAPAGSSGQRTQKPVLHGRHWVAITGKPLAATAGAMMFEKGGNAVDAAAAMLAATCTMWDTLSWGGETQALIYHPKTGKVIGINALGVAPTGATVDFFRSRDMRHPPEFGPLAAVTPGTPGGLMVMLAEFGRLSLEDVLSPAIELAEGYPIETQTANIIERHKERLKQWRNSRRVMLPHLGQEREAPRGGEIFRQTDLATTLKKLVQAERQALEQGKSRGDAIYAAYDRFYRGDIAREFVRGVQEEGGLITLEDLAGWSVKIEEPVTTDYKGIHVYKLTHWTQGPVMLQALNMLENFDLKAMGYNSARYIHTLYQVMNLAFADRDFYYGDPAFLPEEPIRGLLSKDYARERIKQIDWERNDPRAGPGDPYPFQGKVNPFLEHLESWRKMETGSQEPDREESTSPAPAHDRTPPPGEAAAGPTGATPFEEAFYRGTTSIQAADAEGWVVSVTPSGGWIPAVIAGETGVGLSQRMQSFVLDEAEGPFNVLEPGKQPRVTLTPSMALKDGKPFLSFAVQGGDSQDQNLLQFFLNVVEFGMNVQLAAEAANFNSFQLRASFGRHASQPGRLLLHEEVPSWVRSELRRMEYDLTFGERTSGPINAIFFDRKHATMWGGSSHHGEDYGIAW
ncbi:MAG TPA: gamma-glutamyltransferase [Verrucomicrobiales bacterium]|nr:gamma-glutamyltransferase [Verrucomicrobiales bacterium]